MARKMRYIFDNSNLNESYAGLTSPLTFSFARRSYKRVYIALCELFGVSQKSIEQNQDLFPNMLEYLGGRMYYNLINWYRLIALFPGYKFNRKFFENMLGVEEEYRYKKESNSNIVSKAFDLVHLIYRMIRMIVSFLFMKRLVKQFNNEFDEKYSYLQSVDLKTKTDKELIGFYKSFEDKLTKNFSIPIANDFAVMISVGLLKSLCKKWLFDNDGNKVNVLISGGNGLKSAELGRAIEEILVYVRKDKKRQKLFNQYSTSHILSIINSDGNFSNLKKRIFYYVNTYGYRVPGELKLESISFQNNPVVLIKLLKNMLRKSSNQIKQLPDEKVRSEVSRLSLIKRPLFNFVTKWARSSIAIREDTRFKRTLIFAVARKVFQEFGERLRKQGLLNKASDIFYLQVEEIFTSVGGMGKKQYYLKLVKKRQSLDKVFRKIDMPRRIITEKSSQEYNKQLIKMKIKRLNRDIRPVGVKGQLASMNGKKVIIGTSLVLTNFDPNQDYKDKILVTGQTDPGWTMVFPALKGIVVERGGILSHAAIIAREFGIPCIINATDATKIIPNGKKIKMELMKGFVALHA